MENGSTYNWRTMGSYNRASYKPTLIIEYTSGDYQLITNGTYYFNNRNTGKYLRYNDGSVSGMSGLLGGLGNSIQWELVNRSNGNGYVIRAKNDHTKYLGVSTYASSDNVNIVTVSDEAIPSRCIWSLSIANGLGCLVRSTYNSKYLYSDGTSLYTSDTTGATGTSTYYSRVWRVAKTTSYGNTSALDSRELNGFSIASMVLNTGESQAPTITKTPSDAVWADVMDFTYSGYDGTKLSYDTATGKFSPASSLNTAYAPTVTATHKVTGRTATFTVAVNRQAALIGVTNLGHNHDVVLELVIPNVENCGYSTVYERGPFTTGQIDEYLDNDVNKIFVSRSHGHYHMDETFTDEVGGTCIMLNDDFDNPVCYSSEGSITSLDLSNLELAIFAGCYTGYGGEYGANLPSVAVMQGARTAIGFDNEIDCDKTHQWLDMLFDQLGEGVTISEAIDNIKEYFVGTPLENPVICGDRTTIIKK